jgi:hypothetical protein
MKAGSPSGLLFYDISVSIATILILYRCNSNEVTDVGAIISRGIMALRERRRACRDASILAHPASYSLGLRPRPRHRGRISFLRRSALSGFSG